MRKDAIASAPRPTGRFTLATGLLSAAGLFGCGGDAGNGGDDTPEAAPLLKGITAAHNLARASVLPAAATPLPPLEWSASLAATAQAWADRCGLQHSGGDHGENLYADTGQGTAASVVADWVAEQADYDYATNRCAGACGKYTQVVWAQSLRLGCGVARCTTGSPFGGGAWSLWVCNYDPPGNTADQRPY
jgi:pathogenesis-related protein 1